MLNEAGVVYYNIGTGCAVRMLVSIASLRKHYSGPITILSEGSDSHPFCAQIAEAFAADWKAWDSGFRGVRNARYLAKTRYHLASPYEVTAALDSDTLVTGPIDELLVLAREHSFCVARLGQWRTDGPIISNRIHAWNEILPEDVAPALAFGPAINCGVVAFRADAPLLAEWHQVAVRGCDSFIPDEVSCQLLLHRYPHHILDGRWNCSCKYDDPSRPEVRIIHFHGRKHCRPGLPFGGRKWVAAWQEQVRRNVAGLQAWQPAGDRMLARFLRRQAGRRRR